MMNNKRWIIIILVGFLFIPINFFVPNAVGDPPISWEWSMDGDTVFINNSKVFLSANPAVLGGSGWVEFSFESKEFGGELDALWGFNSTVGVPRSPQIWRNYTHIISGYHWEEEYLDRVFDNCTDKEVLNISDYDLYPDVIGNKNNTKLWNLICGNISYFIAFTTKTILDADSIQFFYFDSVWSSYQYEETFWDWKTFEKTITVETYDWDGFDKWYSVNATVQEDKLYSVRAWVDIPFGGLSGTSGKYVWAIKEHSKTMQEAIDTGRLLYLDPWWDSDWTYYRTITIDKDLVDTDLVNFPVLVNSTDVAMIDKCDGGDSIRFTAGSNSGGTDNVTLYAYEIEEFNVGGFSIHVNVTEVYSGSDTVFNMYYNNSGASDNQNHTGVWNSNYLAVWHMNDSTTSTILDSTSNDYDGAKRVANEPIETASGKIGKAQNFDGNDDYVDIGYDTSLRVTTMTIEAWCETDDNSVRQEIATKDDEWYFWLNNDFYLDYEPHAGGIAKDSVFLTNDTWYYVVGVYDGSNSLLYKDSVLIDTTSGDAPLQDGHNFIIGAHGNGVNGGTPNLIFWDGIIDEVRYSDIARNASWLNATFHSQNQTSGFMTFGAEVSYVPSGFNVTISDEYPVDGSVGVCPTSMELGITVSVTNTSSMDLTFWSNLSGTWDYFYLGTVGVTLASVGNGTYYIDPLYFNGYDTLYYWYVSVLVAGNVTNSSVFTFTTDSEPCGATGGGGGGVVSGNGAALALGAGGMMIGMFAIVMNRRRKKV